MILTIENPGSLLAIELRREITREEADAVRALLDPPDPLRPPTRLPLSAHASECVDHMYRITKTATADRKCICGAEA